MGNDRDDNEGDDRMMGQAERMKEGKNIKEKEKGGV